MGAWGAKIYQNDVGQDVRHEYKEYLRFGKTARDATKELLANNADILEDTDDSVDFWLALADTQWTLGRLEDVVKEKALQIIEDGSGMDRWGELVPPENKASERLLQQREHALQELKNKLLTPQPPEKKVSRYNIYKCQWKIGDVYAYPLDSDYAKEKGLDGKCFLLHKVGETIYHPRHIIPVVRLKMADLSALPLTAEEFDKLEYIQCGQASHSTVWPGIDSVGMHVNGKKCNELVRNRYGEVPTYRMELINTSKRAIPKKIIYVGHFPNVTPPVLEYVEAEFFTGYLWKYFEELTLKLYFHYNVRN